MRETPTFVKWAGGKKQLIEQFKEFFPDKFNNYFEPFVGGGAVAFYILQNHNPKKVFLSDINEDLVNAYNVIKKDPAELIKILKKYKGQHNKKLYYKLRNQDAAKLSPVKRAARFIYLNKTCFNGLFRVNSKGQFNVPIGSYKNPDIAQEEKLKEISALLKNAIINLDDFEKVVSLANKGDFIYFDPPYFPLKKGKSFTTYTKDKFLEEEQERLAKVFKKIHKKGCLVMLSNSDTKFIKDLYKGFNINTVRATRMINCDAEKRGKINEIVVTNY